MTKKLDKCGYCGKSFEECVSNHVHYCKREIPDSFHVFNSKIEKDKQIVKRLEERKEKANQANHIKDGDVMTLSKFDADEFKLYNELQKILEET